VGGTSRIREMGVALTPLFPFAHFDLSVSDFAHKIGFVLLLVF
jgi:hypothetical protein